MTDPRFVRLEDVILDECFPELDLALRRGRHVDRNDAEWYALLTDGQELLEPLYRRYGCELIQKSEGYFYLLPTNERLGRRQLSASEMMVGQALALLYLDPKAVEDGGLVTREQVLGHLAGVVGSEALVVALNPKRKRYDERVAAETVRSKVTDAIRRLGLLGFVEQLDEERLRLRPSLMRFAEPVRGSGSPEGELERLVAAGEIVLEEGRDEPDAGGEADEEPSTDDDEDDLPGGHRGAEDDDGDHRGAEDDASRAPE